LDAKERECVAEEANRKREEAQKAEALKGKRLRKLMH